MGVFTSQESKPGHQEGEWQAQVTKQSVKELGLEPEGEANRPP